MIASRPLALRAASRKRMSIAALSGSEPVAPWHGGMAQAASSCEHKGSTRLPVDVAFAVLPVVPFAETFPCMSEAWGRRFALAVVRIVHGSYRPVVELLLDLFGLSLSIETLHFTPDRSGRAAPVTKRLACRSCPRVPGRRTRRTGT